MDKMRARLKGEKLWLLYKHVEMPMVPVLAVLELQHFKINLQTLAAFSDVLKVVFSTNCAI